MRFKGTLSKWNDERGFGFIRPAEGGPDVFVHISAYPKDGQRPRLNEVLSFGVGQAADGKRRAVDIRRTDSARSLEGREEAHQPRQSRNLTFGVTSLLLVCALGAYGYTQYSRHAATAEVTSEAVSAADLSHRENSPSPFSCDGRVHCSQMTSCEEAMYFLKHCPGVQMDGNNDGEPCEQQWCTASSDH